MKAIDFKVPFFWNWDYVQDSKDYVTKIANVIADKEHWCEVLNIEFPSDPNAKYCYLHLRTFRDDNTQLTDSEAIAQCVWFVSQEVQSHRFPFYKKEFEQRYEKAYLFAKYIRDADFEKYLKNPLDALNRQNRDASDMASSFLSKEFPKIILRHETT